ncbi:MAG: PKD domain-containing protein [Nanoarchaeota archaeon]|nr:PKD domain-containing protein [Nanoarchaeota archaeon]
MNKKGFVGIILIILASSVYAACFDDDGGINYKQKGFCKDTYETEGADFCREGELIEYYCHQGFCKAQIKTCSDCKDGVCLSKEADEITEVNRPPEVDLFIMATPGKTEVAFRASVSDPDKEMVVYTIEFGDGYKASNKADVIHDYKTTGNFTVTITARDLSGAKTTFSKEVTVEEQKILEEPKEKTIKEEKETAQKGFFTKIKDFFKRLFGKG